MSKKAPIKLKVNRRNEKMKQNVSNRPDVQCASRVCNLSFKAVFSKKNPGVQIKKFCSDKCRRDEQRAEKKFFICCPKCNTIVQGSMAKLLKNNSGPAYQKLCQFFSDKNLLEADFEQIQEVGR